MAPRNPCTTSSAAGATGTSRNRTSWAPRTSSLLPDLHARPFAQALHRTPRARAASSQNARLARARRLKRRWWRCSMDARPPITPLPSHRSRHAGPIAVGLLVSATALVWTSRDDTPDRWELPAAPLVAREAPGPELASIELEPGVATAVVAERE